MVLDIAKLNKDTHEEGFHYPIIIKWINNKQSVDIFGYSVYFTVIRSIRGGKSILQVYIESDLVW